MQCDGEVVKNTILATLEGWSMIPRPYSGDRGVAHIQATEECWTMRLGIDSRGDPSASFEMPPLDPKLTVGVKMGAGDGGATDVTTSP